MKTDQFGDIARKLAVLAAKPDSSFAVRSFLNSSATREIVDVTHEIDCLGRILDEHTPVKREP